MTLTYGSLCTGYGGIELGLSMLTELDVRWQAENDKHASKILDARFPDVPNHGDLTAVDWTQVEPVDVISAGYPCQPFSHAGKRKGTEDERHIWPAVRDAVSALRPRYVFLENVAGHVSLGFADVLADLATLRYDATWCVVRASDAGAPHGRARLFILATDTRRDGLDERSWLAGIVAGAQDARAREGAQRQRDGHTTRDSGPTVADARHRPGEPQRSRPESAIGTTPNTDGPRRQTRQHVGEPTSPQDTRTIGDRGTSTNTAGDGRNERWAEPAGQLRRLDVAECGDETTADPRGKRRIGDTCFEGDGWPANVRSEKVGPPGDRAVTWGDYEPAIRRWEHVTARPAPRPTEPGTRGGERLSPAFVEWLMGLPAGWVTDIDITRNEKLKALGNGVVPQQCALAVRTLLQLEARECAA